jgi:hypothetical protein
MKKTLSARIAERMGLETPSRHGKNRAAFLALRPDIKQALDDGWPVKTIWKTLHEEGKITFGYQAFRGYANRLILSHNNEEPAPSALTESKSASNLANATEPVTDASKPPEKKVKPGTLPGFTYNPVPNLEELF